MESLNPFSLVRASDYTDDQINRLWVELGKEQIDAVIEPRSRISKFILGGKGTGKTHLLRYYSYPVIRLRRKKESGIEIIKNEKFIAVFLRATGVDATRFECASDFTNKWQQLFGIYLELRLAEGLLDILCDIRETSPDSTFHDKEFISEISRSVISKDLETLNSLEDFKGWVVKRRREIDDAVNNAAFTGSLELHVPFSIGALALPIKRAMAKWNHEIDEFPLLYLIDEVENFTESQQQVINSLIRYGESNATFRVTGRLYAVKTYSTLANGEENREGSEFKITHLDEILRAYKDYPKFSKKFVIKRLQSCGVVPESLESENNPAKDPATYFKEVSTSDFYKNAIREMGVDQSQSNFVASFEKELEYLDEKGARLVGDLLTKDVPLILKKLNILLFCKKMKKSPVVDVELAKRLRRDSLNFATSNGSPEKYYRTAYGHWGYDLFAQICRDSKSRSTVPYAGFEYFLKMTLGNPRSLLIILGHIYSIARFRGVDFAGDAKLSVEIQTEAAHEAARFMFEYDSNYGGNSEIPRRAVSRLATLLRTARYALNIPEVSPLAVSFSDSDLSQSARITLNSALNYSFLFEGKMNRPDRNSDRVNRKIQLNPMLSPKWLLPIQRRGDLSLNRDLLNSIFDPEKSEEFEVLLKRMNVKWNHPFKSRSDGVEQKELF